MADISMLYAVATNDDVVAADHNTLVTAITNVNTGLADAVTTAEAWGSPSGFRVWTDCDRSVAGGSTGWTKANAGGGVAPEATSTNATADHPGVWSLSTGAGSWSQIAYYDFSYGPSYLLGGGTWALETLVLIGSLSTGGDNFNYYFGMGDNGGGTPNNGCYFEYDHDVTANWGIVTASGGTRTKTATSVVASAATWFRLRVEINAAASSVEFFIDGVSVGTHTTNIPTANRCYPIHSTTRSAGSTDRPIFIDFNDIVHQLTNSR